MSDKKCTVIKKIQERYWQEFRLLDDELYRLAMMHSVSVELLKKNPPTLSVSERLKIRRILQKQLNLLHLIKESQKLQILKHPIVNLQSYRELKQT